MKQQGFILIAALVFLVIMTLIGVAMFNGFTQDEAMSGNYREKARALDAAQTALDAAESWMVQPGNTFTGNWVTGTNCTGVSSTPVVCSNAVQNPATSSWASYVTFTPPGMTVNTTGGANTYISNTKYYIQYLGVTSANPPASLYQVTSTAAGGNATAVAVVQAVYEVQAGSTDIGGG
ncbi:MAG: PilX N-terminal domain-containing pilus assembly protein [Rhodocyclaceae bacterium]|nr:PilX N-terminal domain-containing pilus assembly protein [Rhodocyclaceae bacterium]